MTGLGGADDRQSARRVFVRLLVQPLVTSSVDPALLRDLGRHSAQVDELARRLGYRLVRLSTATRLVRMPVNGSVAAPPAPMDAPGRQILSLACVLAAACEEAYTVTTLAELSSLVTDLTATDRDLGLGYDQNRRADRRALVAAADLLRRWGVLTDREQRGGVDDSWTESGTGPGQVYEIDREALLLFVMPEVLAALEPDPDEELAGATRAVRAVRALVETPAVCYAELEPADAEVLRATRGLRAAEAIGLVGGVVEPRAEGMLLVLPDEPPSPAGVDWPRAQTVSWAALLAIDAIDGRTSPGPDGTHSLGTTEIESVIDALIRSHGRYMAEEYKSNPVRLQHAVTRQLSALSLIRVSAAGSWQVSPIAGRFRRAEVRAQVLPTTEGAE